MSQERRAGAGRAGSGRRSGRSPRPGPWRQAALGLILLLVAAGLAAYAWATRSEGDEEAAPEPERVLWDAGDRDVREIVIEREGDRLVLRPGPPPELVASPEMPFGGQGPAAAEAIGGLLSARRWWVHSPGPYPVAEEYGADLADRLRKPLADRMVADQVDEGDLAQYGLDRPRVKVTVRFAGEQAARVLELGSDSPLTGGGTYARLAGGRRVWLLPASLADTLRMPVQQLRETMFVPFNDDRVQSVELAWGEERLAFTRQETGTSWTMQRNGRAAGTQDASQLSELWFSLHQWRAQRFVSDGGDEPAERQRYGLDRPFGEIRLRFQPLPGQKAGPELVVRVGRETGDGGRYAMTSEGPWIYALDPDDLKYFQDEVLPALRQPVGKEGDASAPGDKGGGSQGGTGTEGAGGGE